LAVEIGDHGPYFKPRRFAKPVFRAFFRRKLPEPNPVRSLFHFLLFIFHFSVLLLGCQPRHYALTGKSAALLTVADTTARQATDRPLTQEVARYLHPFHDSLDRTMNTVLVRSARRLRKGEPESLLGNLMADALLEIGNERAGKRLDVAMTNSGGIRAELPEGPVTLGNAYEVMPFDNAVVVLTLPGPVMQRFAAYVARELEPQAGLQLVVDKDSKKLVRVLVGGQPIDSTRTYSLVTSDYIANSSGAAAILKQNTGLQTLNLLYRDALIEYLRRRGQRGELLNPQNDGRTKLE